MVTPAQLQAADSAIQNLQNEMGALRTMIAAQNDSLANQGARLSTTEAQLDRALARAETAEKERNDAMVIAARLARGESGGHGWRR